MTRPLNHNPHIPLRSPIHRKSYINLLRRINNILRQASYRTTLLLRPTPHFIWQTRVIRIELVVDGLWLLRMPGPVRPVVIDFLAG